MPAIVAMSRPLPLPEMELGGQKVTFVHAERAGAIPADAVAYLSTAIDPVDAALIAQLPGSVGLIANLGVGYDNIRVEFALAVLLHVAYNLPAAIGSVILVDIAG